MAASSSSSNKPLCLVRSSINIDSMFAVPHVVKPGETLSSSKMEQRPGGKGANVCAAVALAEQHVVMSGAVGKDAQWPIDELKSRGVDTTSIRILNDVPTGRAFIQVAEDGENSIVLLKGANFAPDSVADDPAKVFANAPAAPSHLILQNEIPLATTMAFLTYAHEGQSKSGARRCTTVFNPSPMLTRDELQAFPWQHVDVLIVNEGEGQELVEAMGQGTGAKDDVLSILDELSAFKKASWIVMTRGSRGVSAVVRTKPSERTRINVDAAKPKRVQDTTGAGDTFAGNLVAGLMRLHGESVSTDGDDDGLVVSMQDAREILQWAGAAAAVAVETDGAMESIPRLQDVQKRKAELVA